jgi:uncharacterized protein (TIGR02284 family)
MKTDKKVIDTLNDLIKVNMDRIEGYEKAAEEVKDSFEAEVKTVFYEMADESRRYKEALSAEVVNLGGEPATDTSAAGDIYRAWMDVKVAFSGSDVLAALQSCEYGEDNALKTYKKALEKDANWPAETMNLISNQRQSLKASHDRIKRYRDEHAAKSHEVHH